MLLTYRYKLAPRRPQYVDLDRVCEMQRDLYNAALQERRDAWRLARRSISKVDQFKSLTEIRAFDAEHASLPVAMSRWTLSRVDDAFAGFFSRAKSGRSAGFPRFKSASRWRTFGFSEMKGARLKGDRLHIAPLRGCIKVRMHRRLPEGATVRSCSLTRDGRHWWVSLSVSVPTPESHSHPGSAVGLDFGVTSLLTTSEGEKIENPRVGALASRSIRRASRALNRCSRGSKRRAKIRERLRRLQAATARRRSAHLHLVSAGIAERYSLVAVERLNFQGMTRSGAGRTDNGSYRPRYKRGLNKAILDAAGAKLLSMIAYKAARAGGAMVEVDPRGTSMECSACGSVSRKTLRVRTHSCECGAEIDRDVNAAINILNRALSGRGRAKPPGGANRLA